MIHGIKIGDDSIMEYAYRLYYPFIAGFIKKNSGSETDAEDIYQEGLLVVFRKIRAGEKVQFLKSYIYSVCRLKWLNELRNRRRHPVDLIENHEQFFGDMEDIERNELPYHATMNEALQALDDLCRKLLLAFYFEKLSMETIAQRFNYSQANTAKAKKNKCMDRIRSKAKKLLEQNYHEK
jgi:RNA polymerase sigma factor (sigma-70 family)